MNYFNLITYFWLRSVIFSTAPLRQVEKRLLERKYLNTKFHPQGYLDALNTIIPAASRTGKPLSETSFLEVGSGQALVLPLMLKILGARSVTTIDIDDISVFNIAKNALLNLIQNENFLQLAQGTKLPKEFNSLDISNATCMPELLALFGVRYIPDCNLSDPKAFTTHNITDVDVVYSNNVLEHIPESVLREILANCNRFLNDKSLQIHLIDLGDHFSYAAKKLNPLNFLTYTDFQWKLIAGNRQIYQNRLRSKDYLSLFKSIYKRVDFDVIKRLSRDQFDAIHPHIKEKFSINEKHLDALRLLIVSQGN